MHNLDTTTERNQIQGNREADRPDDPGFDDARSDDPRRRELIALHAERAELEQRLARAEQERLYLSDPAAVAAAQGEEAALLAELDRLMTRIRAAEYRSQPGARTW
ncbi:hypothetical protein [Methylobacterium sp. Gmos1]